MRSLLTGFTRRCVRTPDVPGLDLGVIWALRLLRGDIRGTYEDSMDVKHLYGSGSSATGFRPKCQVFPQAAANRGYLIRAGAMSIPSLLAAGTKVFVSNTGRTGRRGAP